MKTLWNFTATCCCDLIGNAKYRWERRSLHFGEDGANPVIPPIFAKIALPFMGQQQAGSLTGAVPCRKDIDRTQRQAHPAWKSGVECEGKSSTECVLHSKKRIDESLA